jgi:copper chaperone CopZ
MRSLPVLLVGLLLGSCGAEAAPMPAWRGEGPLVEFTVPELHCDGCEKTLEDELALVEGVESVLADHETKLVLVTLEADAVRETVIPDLRDAVHEAGMQVFGKDEID